MTACRECHRDDEHQLSCSHVRYESRTVIHPADEVAVDHVPATPYCPGPEVECYYTGDGDLPYCPQTGGACYYAAEGAN